jgi:2'-5' RNA ligase
MPQLVALDVAILLPPDINDVAIALSGGLNSEPSEGLRLGAARLPHVTLTQQFVRTEHLEDVRQAVGGVLAGKLPLPLRIVAGRRQGRALWIAIEGTEELNALHDRLMTILLPFEQRGRADAFIGEPARSSDVDWVQTYRRKASFARFTPHVTLGHGARAPQLQPLSFYARDIAACHLGRFCACRAVLGRWTLTAV